MLETNKRYLFWIFLHIAIGALLFYLPFFPKLYGYSIIIGGILIVINAQNKNNEVLYVAAYIVGSEVVLRMTDGNPIYEFSKYGVMIFMFLGIYYSGISKNAIPYWIFLLLLIPGVIMSTYVLDYHANLRKQISFNISGPVCLAVCSLYAYRRKVTLNQINNIFLAVGLPIISCMVYLTIFTPTIKDIVKGTGSNFELTGGFGPNQVATILGLGMFIFVSRLIYGSQTKLLFFVNLVIALNISFRGLVTFSRGGVITGVAMIILLILVTYTRVNSYGRSKIVYLIFFLMVAVAATWTYSSNQTNGLIEKRYANKDAAGRIKEDQLSGRAELISDEIDAFLSHPFFGVGVAKNQEIRMEKTGLLIVSHDEITRMMAEHGSLGIIALMILFATPLILYFDNKYNIYLLCCLTFWLLTINHAAMRIAAPAFIYSLSLLKVVLNEEELIVHRE